MRQHSSSQPYCAPVIYRIRYCRGVQAELLRAIVQLRQDILGGSKTRVFTRPSAVFRTLLFSVGFLRVGASRLLKPYCFWGDFKGSNVLKFGSWNPTLSDRLVLLWGPDRKPCFISSFVHFFIIASTNADYADQTLSHTDCSVTQTDSMVVP